jgi:hypothetical protein
MLSRNCSPAVNAPGSEVFHFRELLGLSAVLGAALVIFRRAPFGFFAQDDFGWLWFSRYHSVGEYLQCFLRFNGAGFYRPLSQETFFWLGQKLFGMNPFGFHLINLGLHLLASACLYLVLRSFFGGFASLLGTLFYAVHSAHLSSVQWISAAPEPMAAALFFSSVFFFIRFQSKGSISLWFLSFAAMVLGVMSKESILTLPLVLAAYCLLFAPRRLPWVTPHFALAGLYVVLRVTSRIEMSPYSLTFGWETGRNLERYLSWTGCFSDVFVLSKLRWNPETSQSLLSAIVLLGFAGLFFFSKNRRAALWSFAWYFLALQPVLYFSGHIYPYYLSSSLAAISLLIASVIPRAINWKACTVGLLITGFCLWSSEASIKREGRWWNERTYVARDVVTALPRMDAQMPPGHSAYLFGFTPNELGMMLQEMALKAYGYESPRFVIAGRKTVADTGILREDGIERYHCFLYSQGQFFDMADEIRRGADFVAESAVGLEPSSSWVDARSDPIVFRLTNLNAQTLDVLYTRDGLLEPVITNCPLDALYRLTVFRKSSAAKGAYRYCAIRDSAAGQQSPWYLVNQTIEVK